MTTTVSIGFDTNFGITPTPAADGSDLRVGQLFYVKEAGQITAIRLYVTSDMISHVEKSFVPILVDARTGLVVATGPAVQQSLATAGFNNYPLTTPYTVEANHTYMAQMVTCDYSVHAQQFGTTSGASAAGYNGPYSNSYMAVISKGTAFPDTIASSYGTGNYNDWFAYTTTAPTVGGAWNAGASSGNYGSFNASYYGLDVLFAPNSLNPTSTPTTGQAQIAVGSSSSASSQVNPTAFPGVDMLSVMTSADFGTAGFLEAISFQSLVSGTPLRGARYGAAPDLAGGTLQFFIQTGTQSSRTTVFTSSTKTIVAGWNEIDFSFTPTAGTTYWLTAAITGNGSHYYLSNSALANYTSADGLFKMANPANGYTTTPSSVTGALTDDASETIPLDILYTSTGPYNFPTSAGAPLPSSMSTTHRGGSFWSIIQVTASQDVVISGLRMFSYGTCSLTGYILTGTASSRTVVATTNTIAAMTDGAWNTVTFSTPYKLTAGQTVWFGVDIGTDAYYYYLNSGVITTGLADNSLQVASGQALYGSGTAATGSGTGWTGWNAFDINYSPVQPPVGRAPVAIGSSSSTVSIDVATGRATTAAGSSSASVPVAVGAGHPTVAVGSSAGAVSVAIGTGHPAVSIGSATQVSAVETATGHGALAVSSTSGASALGIAAGQGGVASTASSEGSPVATASGTATLTMTNGSAAVTVQAGASTGLAQVTISSSSSSSTIETASGSSTVVATASGNAISVAITSGRTNTSVSAQSASFATSITAGAASLAIGSSSDTSGTSEFTGIASVSVHSTSTAITIVEVEGTASEHIGSSSRASSVDGLPVHYTYEIGIMDSPYSVLATEAVYYAAGINHDRFTVTLG